MTFIDPVVLGQDPNLVILLWRVCQGRVAYVCRYCQCPMSLEHGPCDTCMAETERSTDLD